MSNKLLYSTLHLSDVTDEAVEVVAFQVPSDRVQQCYKVVQLYIKTCARANLTAAA